MFATGIVLFRGIIKKNTFGNVICVGARLRTNTTRHPLIHTLIHWVCIVVIGEENKSTIPKGQRKSIAWIDFSMIQMFTKWDKWSKKADVFKFNESIKQLVSLFIYLFCFVLIVCVCSFHITLTIPSANHSPSPYRPTPPLSHPHPESRRMNMLMNYFERSRKQRAKRN